MRVRLLIASAAAALLTAGLMPAQATPYAGQYRYLSVSSLAIQGADGARWVLSLRATRNGEHGTRVEQSLYLDLRRCTGSGCVDRGRWVRPLSDSEISFTGNVAYTPVDTAGSAQGTLRATLGGLRLGVTMREDGSRTGGVNGLAPSSTPPGVAPKVHDEVPSSGRLTIGGLSCAIGGDRGYVGEVTLIDTVGTETRDPRVAPPAQLPAGFLTGKAKARC